MENNENTDLEKARDLSFELFKGEVARSERDSRRPGIDTPIGSTLLPATARSHRQANQTPLR